MVDLEPARRPGHDDDHLRRPREQGQHRPARRHARPHGRPVGPDHRRPRAEQLPRGDDRPRVLHLDPRRPQGPRRHGPSNGRLGLPDPAPRRCRPGRHHPRRRLRDGGGELDHPGRVERRAGRLPASPRRAARRRHAHRGDGQGRPDPGRAQRGDQRGDRGRDRRGRHRRGPRPLTAHLRGALRRLPLLLRPQPRHRRAGRLRRGGRHHRRPVDRRAGHPADDADLPHRWCGRARHHGRPAPRRGAVRGPHPQGQGRDQPHRRHRRDRPRRGPDRRSRSRAPSRTTPP